MFHLMWPPWRTDRRRRPWRRPACLILLLCLLAPALPPAAVWAQGVSTGDGAWTWQNPSGQGNDLHNIRFADANTGWAVGKGGLILRTTDGGSSWTLQAWGIDQALFGLAALDGNSAVVVGPGGTVLVTADGGATWTKGVGAGSAFLLHVQYAKPPGAPAYGRVLYAIGLHGVLLRSWDGGATWHQATAFFAGLELRDLQFLNAATGFVLADVPGEGTALFSTGDFGVTWRRLGVPGGRALRAFRLLEDGATGLAVGDGGRVLKTADGGETWRAVPVPTAADLFAVALSDPTTAHAMGDGGVVLKSVDGGESWALLYEPRPPTAKLVSASFVDGMTGYVAGFHGTLLKTTDAGATWGSLTRRPQQPRGGLRAVHFVSPEVAIAVGERGAIAKSADRGLTWRAVRSGTERNLNSLRFLNRQTGFAVGDGGMILRTDDTGETWRQVPSPVGLNLRAIGLGGDPDTGRLEVALIVGDTNLVLRSADQGATWAQIPLPSPADQLFSVHFPEPRIGFIGGLRTIWQSTDFGRTWRVVAGGGGPRVPPRDPLGFSFPSINRGYAVGVQGQISRTNDGGTTWAPQASRTTRTLRSVHFVDEQTGYIAGDEGTILVTNNGGESWTAVNSGTHLNLWSVQFVDRAVGLAAGEGGAVLKTTSAGLPTRAVPPSVMAVSPADNQTDVLVDERARITFSKDIAFDPADYGETGRFQLRDAERRLVAATATYDSSNRQVVLTPAQPLTPDAAYALTVRGGPDGVADLDGRPMAFEVRRSFRTACEIQAGAGFGLLLFRNAAARDRIGCPTVAEYAIDAAEQVFEGGRMLWRADTRQLFATFFDTGRWDAYADTDQEGEAEPVVPAPEGLLAPGRGFGKVWREQPGVRDRLGWAVGPERGFQGAAQDFTGGMLLTWADVEQLITRVYYTQPR